MTPAVAMAALAAALGVHAAWEALAALDEARLAPRLARTLAVVRLAGREGRAPSVVERRRLALVAAGALLAGGWLVAGPLAGLGLAAAGPWGAGRLVALRRRRWRAALAAAAPQAARSLADALAGGHALRGALAAAAADGGVPEPAGSELRAAAGAMAVGARTEDVLERLRRRAADPGWDTLIAAALLQRDAGGDLAALLRSLAGSLEDAARVRADARSATAQARFTAWLVAGLPLGAAALGELAAPGSLKAIVTAPLPAACALVALVLQVAGFAVIRRLARPDGATS